MRTVDMAPETDLDHLAGIALQLSEQVRDECPHRVRRELIGLCERHPVKAAQLLMAFAIWLDPATTTKQLDATAAGVERSRVRTATLRSA